jgi:hypothetical protein
VKLPDEKLCTASSEDWGFVCPRFHLSLKPTIITKRHNQPSWALAHDSSEFGKKFSLICLGCLKSSQRREALRSLLAQKAQLRGKKSFRLVKVCDEKFMAQSFSSLSMFSSLKSLFLLATTSPWKSTVVNRLDNTKRAFIDQHRGIFGNVDFSLFRI